MGYLSVCAYALLTFAARQANKQFMPNQDLRTSLNHVFFYRVNTIGCIRIRWPAVIRKVIGRWVGRFAGELEPPLYL